MLIPALDFQNGRIVQLVQGERLALTTDDLDGWLDRFSRFPIVQVIDLDAAMGRGDNHALVECVIRARPCRVGGGVRSIPRARALLDLGAHQVIVGSALFAGGRPNLEFAGQLADAVGYERVIGALDSRGGRVVVDGWRRPVPLCAADAARALEPFCGGFLYTHVDVEGLMAGPDVPAILDVRRATIRPLAAAGGIATAAQVADLDARGVDAVVGMAIFTGRLALDGPTGAARQP